MKHNIYAVYDSKVGTYDKPFLMKTRGEALRGWQTVVNKSDTQFAQYPGDFTLFELGTYDDETGRHENHSTPISCGTALEYRREDDVPVKLDPKGRGKIAPQATASN